MREQWLTPDIIPIAKEIGGDPGVTSLRFGQDDDTLFIGTRNGLLLRLSLNQSPPLVKYAHASRGGVLARPSADGRYCVTVTSRQQKLPGQHDERMRCFDATTLEELGVSEANERFTSLSIAPHGSSISVALDTPDETRPESLEYSLPDFTRLRTFSGVNAEYHPWVTRFSRVSMQPTSGSISTKPRIQPPICLGQRSPRLHIAFQPFSISK